MPETTPAVPDWRDYECQIHQELVTVYRDATVSHNVRMPGRKSGVPRQLDVLVEETLQGRLTRTAVDTKYYAKPLDVRDVESFIGMLDDVGVERGLMVSPTGYTPAALARAFRDDVDLDLDIVTLDEFKRWQTACAIPYAGRTAVLIGAPLGWTIESGPVDGVLARLYRRGWTFDEAKRASEFMYLNIWDRDDPAANLDQLLEKQRHDILRSYPDAMITVRDFAPRTGFRTCLRRAEIPAYASAEFTGFIEFTYGILFVALFTPLLVERRNLRKLEYLLLKALPMTVQHAA